MREYTSLSDTPLNFHRFFLYLCLPIDIIVNGGAFLIGLLMLSYMDPLSILQLALNLGVILLAIVILAGAGRWQRYSYFSIFALIWLHMGFSLFFSGFYIFYAPQSLPSTLLAAVFVCSFGFVSMFYYLNRRHLFFPEESAFLQEDTVEVAPQPPLDPLDIDFVGDDSYTYEDADQPNSAVAATSGEAEQEEATPVSISTGNDVIADDLATGLDSPLAMATVAVARASATPCDPVAHSITIHFCSDCGAKIARDHAKFCHHCGGKLH